MGSVFCENSGNTYPSLPAADDGERLIHLGQGEVHLIVSGEISGDVVFSGQDFDSLKITVAPGEEFNPQGGTGARHTDALTASCPTIINGLRVHQAKMSNCPDFKCYNAEIEVYKNSSWVGVNLSQQSATHSAYIYNTVIHNAYRGVYALAANANNVLESCTIYDISNLGFLRCTCINTVAINVGSTDYFDTASQTNTWGEDASAQNQILDGTATFVDYANGDIRIRADSAAGRAGAGAFIEQVVGGEDIGFPSSENLTLIEMAGFTRSTAYHSVDSLGLTEGSGFVLLAAFRSSELLNLVEVSQLSAQAQFPSSETITLNEQASAQLTRPFASAEDLGLVEASSLSLAGKDQVFSAVEHLGLSEQSGFAINRYWQHQEHLNLIETSSLDAAAWFGSSEFLNLQEHSDLSASFKLTSVEELNLDEAATLQVERSFNALEDLALREIYTLLINDRLQPAILLGLIYNDQINGTLTTDQLIGVIN